MWKALWKVLGTLGEVDWFVMIDDDLPPGVGARKECPILRLGSDAPL